MCSICFLVTMVTLTRLSPYLDLGHRFPQTHQPLFLDAVRSVGFWAASEPRQSLPAYLMPYSNLLCGLLPASLASTWKSRSVSSGLRSHQPSCRFPLAQLYRGIWFGAPVFQAHLQCSLLSFEYIFISPQAGGIYFQPLIRISVRCFIYLHFNFCQIIFF